jgi:undecaprenyl-diphosphatase
MTLIQVVVLALIQGVTELFPISSLGHAVIIPDILNWNLDQQGEWFLPFLVVMHLGTAIALLIYFWRDWFDFGVAVVFNRGARPAQERRLFWRVVVATVPAVIVGAVFEKMLKQFAFGLPGVACAFLIINGVILFAAERMKRPEQKGIDALTWLDALVIGVWQCLALIPGISRSGVTMVGGFRAGLDHKDAARFSFLTATPIIIGATVLEAPKLLKHGAGAATAGAAKGFDPANMLHMAVLAGVLAGVAAFASLWVIMRWFKTHEFKAFDPFAYYCMGAGALFLVVDLFT